MDGWKEPTKHIRKYSELPKNAQRYVKVIEEYLNIPGIMIIIIIFPLFGAFYVKN